MTDVIYHDLPYQVIKRYLNIASSFFGYLLYYNTTGRADKFSTAREKYFYRRFRAICTLFVRDTNNRWNSHKSYYLERFRGKKYSAINLPGDRIRMI